MALAVTQGDRTGSGETSVVVAKPLLALPALPRLARVGDTFEAGVVVHAPGRQGAAGRGRGRRHRARPRGGGEAEGRPRPAGKAREVRFRFRAERPGEAVLRFTVSGGGEADGVEQRIPVVLPVAREAVAVHGDTRDVRREALVAARPACAPTWAASSSTLSSTAIAGLQEGMRQLVDYPYGCLEQLSSRLVPFMALRELQGTVRRDRDPGGPKRSPTPGCSTGWARIRRASSRPGTPTRSFDGR